MGEGRVQKNEIGDKRARTIFLEKKYEQTCGSIFSKGCAHVHAEKRTVMSRALLREKEAGESHRHWPWKCCQASAGRPLE